MPFRGSTTVVADTSGVLQGALDFVVRHLHPATRIKVPSIVQMELVNATHRFFNLRRSESRRSFKRRAAELLEHLKSQGGDNGPFYALSCRRMRRSNEPTCSVIHCAAHFNPSATAIFRT